MKLLILDQFSDPGGAQQAVLDLLPAFLDRGWDVRVGLPGDGKLFDQVRAEGVEAQGIDCGAQTPWRKTVGDMARFAAETPRLARQIRALAEGVDLVYLNGPRLLPAAALAKLRAPAVFHAHSYLAPGLVRSVAGAALRRLRASVIANCEFVASAYRPYTAALEVIYLGVRPARRERSSDGQSVACIGRVAPEKGQLEFLAAASSILREAPACRFTVFGDDLFSGDAYADAVRARAAGMPVTFAGWTDNVYAALAHTDVLLVPSTRVEATTRVILEAYAAGVPVVAFANGGIPEVVDHGRTGFLAGSVEDMARYALRLLRDPGLRAAVSASALAEWESRFTLDRFRRNVTAALEGVLRPRSRALPILPARGRSRTA